MIFRRSLSMAAVMTAFIMTGSIARAADDGPTKDQIAEPVTIKSGDRGTSVPAAGLPILSKQNPSSSLADDRPRRMSVAELRQARALLKADQRRARLERNAWIGYEPLRPNWNAVPMYRSRYETRTVYVPVYWYHR